MKFLSALLAVALSTAAVAEDSTPERFAALLTQLSEDDFSRREAAENELAGLDESWRAKLGDALEAAKDPEVKARLKSVLARLDRPRWIFDRETAMAEARRLKRPVLVLCSSGKPDTPRTVSGTKMISDTLNSPEVWKCLREKFVLLWIDLHETAGPNKDWRTFYEDGFSDELLDGVEGGNSENDLMTMVSTPDGWVCHALEGWWPADIWRAECEKGCAWAALDREKVDAARNASVVEIQNEAHKLAAEAAAGDRGKERRAEDMKFLSVRYYGYAVSKYGHGLQEAIQSTVEDFIGRELK